MAVQEGTNPIRDALRAIRHTTRLHHSVAKTAHQETSPENLLLPTHLIAPPSSITTQLEKIGLPPSLAQKTSDSYLKMASDLHRVCEASLRSAIQDPSLQGLLVADKVQALTETWSSMYAEHTRCWADSAQSFAREYVFRPQPLNTPNVAKDARKPTFNHEYTPLLDKYFEYNAYPSAPDRAVLARKSMMTTRQIEVWFQNHRNRAKKDGKALRKLTSNPLPLQLSLESLEYRMPFFTIPEKERKIIKEPELSESNSSDDEEENSPTYPTLSDPREAFTIRAPPHAFPMKFPPTCHYAPFPSKPDDLKFPTPVWMRKPSSSIPFHTPVDFDAFLSDFATKLVIRDGIYKKRRETPPPGAASKHPWFASTHTTPCPAPHPAFIPALVKLTPISLPTTPVVSAPLPRMHPFRSPSPSSLPATSIPTSSSSVTRRKVARLPKRTPHYTSIAHRGTSPTSPEASPSPSSRSLAPSSRASSFSSDSSYLRRPSSSSSNSSTASSTLTTPVFSPISLPENAPSPISISGTDFQNMDDLFGDSSNAMSPLDGLNLNFPSYTSFNVPTIRGKDIFQFGFETPTAHLR